MAKNKYNFIDLFAGCGGLSEGFMQTGYFNALAHVEWELPMVNTLRNRLVKHWGYNQEEAKQSVIHFDVQRTDELLHGNWTECSKKKYQNTNSTNVVKSGMLGLINNQDVDLVIGGPPCQAYSIHGRATDKNSMCYDYRNFLFESFVKVVSKLTPKIFVFENVPGILTAQPGGEKITERIFKAFSEIGYNILEPKNLNNVIFNAVDFRVPQNRKRAIIIGVKQDGEFELAELYESIRGAISKTQINVRDTIGEFPPIKPLNHPIKVNGKNISHKMTNDILAQHTPRYHNVRDVNIFREWVSNKFNYLPGSEKISFYERWTGKKTLYCKYRSLEWDKPSPTVVAHLHKDGLMFIHPDATQARSITVREAAALMSFPIDYEFIGSNAFCYKMIGNAVPVNFAKAIADSIYKIMINKSKK